MGQTAHARNRVGGASLPIPELPDRALNAAAMRSLRIIVGGFLLLALFLAVGRSKGGRRGAAKASLAFIATWFALAAINLTIGVVQAGYTFAEEAPVFVMIFVPHAVVALYFWKRWR